MNDRKLTLVAVCGLCLMGYTAGVSGETKDAATTAAAEVSASAEAAEKTSEAAAEVVDQAVKTVEKMGQEMGGAAKTTTAGEAAGEMMNSDAYAQAMADWMKVANPDENHAKLEPLVGSWDVTTHFWMAPGMPPETSTGVSEIKSILDGRFIQENFEGTMQMPGMEPMPFKGMGLIGYDIAKGEYTGIWADTMATMMINSTGQFDDSTKTLTLKSHFDCPMDGPSDMRMTYTIVSPDELKLEGFKTVEGQEEVKAMEVIYKRRY